jgi:predicted phosphodiesterase
MSGHTPAIIGLIGDVHAEDCLLGQGLGFLAARGVDGILCTGDVVGGLGDVDRCCELLARHEVRTVRGNHDRWFLKGEVLYSASDRDAVGEASRRFLTSLPPTVELRTAAGATLLCHGLGENDMASLKPDDHGYGLESNRDLQRLVETRPYRLVVAGHTHVRMARSLNGVVFVNPGTLLRHQGPGLALLDLPQAAVSFFDLVDGSVRLASTAGLGCA